MHHLSDLVLLPRYFAPKVTPTLTRSYLMKLLPVLLAFANLALTTSAQAAQIYASYDCVPAKPLASPLNVESDQLLDVLSYRSEATVDGNNHTQKTEITSRMHEGLNKRILVVTDQYQPDPYKGILHAVGGLHSLRYDAVVVTHTHDEIPFSAGPVYPGTYPTWATLTLVSSYFDPAEKRKKVESRQIDLNCKYTISYGAF